VGPERHAELYQWIHILDKEATAPVVFTGKVIDQNKNPLPGAALYLAGNGNYTFNTTTDRMASSA